MKTNIKNKHESKRHDAGIQTLPTAYREHEDHHEEQV